MRSDYGFIPPISRELDVMNVPNSINPPAGEHPIKDYSIYIEQVKEPNSPVLNESSPFSINEIIKILQSEDCDLFTSLLSFLKESPQVTAFVQPLLQRLRTEIITTLQEKPLNMFLFINQTVHVLQALVENTTFNIVIYVLFFKLFKFEGFILSSHFVFHSIFKMVDST